MSAPYALVAIALLALASPLRAQVVELPPPRVVSELRPILFEEWADPSSTAHTFFGRSVSIFGNTALVGIPGFRNEVGRVGILRRDEAGQWQRVGSIENPTGTASSFGTSVGLTRDFAFVGTFSSFAGGAAVFRRTKHREFRFLRNITRFFSIDEATGRLFTTSQAADGSTIAKLSELDKRGRLHVVERFTIPSELTVNEFRRAAIWDDVYVLTDPGDNEAQGAAYVFEKRQGRWRLRQKLIAIDGMAGDVFGASVAVHGDTIVIGATGADSVENLCNGFTTASGSVYVFKRRQGIWSEDQKLKSVGEDPRCSDRFGSTVFLSGKVLMILDDRSDSVTISNGWHAFQRQFGQYQPVSYRVDDALGGGSVHDLQGSTFFQGTPTEGCCDETGSVEVWDLTP
jgi:hypothetical protein